MLRTTTRAFQVARIATFTPSRACILSPIHRNSFSTSSIQPQHSSTPSSSSSSSSSSASSSSHSQQPSTGAGSTQTPPTLKSDLNPSATILRTALTFVPQHGWTQQSITKAAESLGYTSMVHGMFPRGGADLIDFFLEDCLRRMPLELEGRMEGLKTSEKVRIGVLTRLGMVAPYIGQWPEALAIMAQPSHVPMSVNHLAKIVDEIWYLAGDKSADMNWYSKRAMLAGVYTSTELFMTTDKTQYFEATQKFLERRFEDVETVGKATGHVGQLVEFGAKSVLGVIASRGFRS